MAPKSAKNGLKNSDKNDAEDEKSNSDRNEKKVQPEAVPFFQLFKFASGTDKILLFIGCFAAFLTGGIFPTMNVLLGYLLDVFVDQTTSYVGFPECLNTTNYTTPMTMPTGGMEEFSADFFQKCETLCIGLLTIGIIQICLTYVMITCLNTVAENQGFRIREKFMRSILRQDIGWFDTNKTGDFASRMTTDLSRVQDGIGQKLGMAISLNCTTIICLVVALYYGWKLTLVILSVMPAIICSSAIIAKVQARLSGGELDAYGKAGAIADEVLSSIRTVVAFGGEKKEIDRYEQNLAVARKSGIKRGLFTGLGNAIFWLFCFASYSLAFWYGTKLILEDRCVHGEYTVSTLYIVFICVLLGAFFVGQSAPYAEAVSVARGAAKTLFDVIAREPPIDSSSQDGEQPSKIEGRLTLRNIRFKYPSRPEISVLNGLTLEALPGETVALVGSSGCGKSTVIQLLQRFYDPLEGRILLDGKDIKRLNIGWLRDHIGIVGQEPVLFDTTIAENIRYGRDNCTQEDIERAAKEANAHVFIRKLPQKYKTMVGERGAQLSGGQKQRIAIARALIKNPKILLLDEATSALDSESESVVQKALDEASVGRTTIVVAHRLSTIRHANKIIALEEGRVKEIGSHDELMEKQGLYYQLVMAQLLEQAENEELIVNRRKSSAYRTSVYSTYSANSLLIDDANEQLDADELEAKKANPSKLRLLKMSVPEWPYFTTGCIASIVMGIMLPVYGIVFGDIVSALSKEGSEAEREVNFFAVIFLIIGIITGIGSFLQALMFAFYGESLTMRIRKMVFTKMITQDMAWFDDKRNGTGALCTKLSADASGVQGAIGNRLSTILQALATLTTSIVISLIYNVKIGLVVMAFIPLVLMGFYFESRVHSGQILSEKKSVEIASKIAVEAIQNIRTVASLHLEDKFCNNYISILNGPHLTAKKKVHIIGLLLGFSQAVPWMAYAAAMYYGSYLIQTGELFYGELFKVTEGVFAGAWMMGPMMALAPDYDKAKVSAVRIFQLLDLPSRINVFSPDGKKPKNFSGKVEFSEVYFSYPTRPDVTILNGINLGVNPGQTVALVGSSGCGKSTVIQLLERFYDAEEGEIMMDGVDLSELDINWLRSQIGLVSQEPVLFGYSIGQNIAYGDNSRHVTMEEITEAAKQANIHNFIQSLPGGYDTDVGTKGTQLSGGQKQRIAIARALVRQPKILLLDEATSALDTESEKIVQEALDKVSKGRTCLTIAHRLSTIQNADQIVVIRKGEVVEKGTHQELLALNRLYYKLYSKQGGSNI